ncbi:phosphatase PAP2 family protein [Aulosira sp. FACHB-615]|uniref:phosphatase PAP2 family protein n=1 Tax=Aulosira sp. FACHB-615 TaxID=2692777 RepID=UPI001683B743|nr:phosphatase PAP2 family protein [Aulosira sp. FACHB-615]MBD2489390.1 phosphatase PAP2 family protein [Aulosira sp. FACHB-615]
MDAEKRTPVSFIRNLLVARWRSLLLLFVGVYLPLQIFQVLAVQVWQYQAGFPWDVPILLAVHSTANPQLDTLAVALTKLGSFWTVLPILITIALILLWQKRWRSLVYLLITALGSAFINRTAKELWHRLRPDFWTSLAPELDFSFPSGHAMTSTTLAIILLILAWQSSWRWVVWIFGSLYILTIAWTRLYLGVHFPSDILAGWMVAIAWGTGVSMIIKPHLVKTLPVPGVQPAAETTLLPEEQEKLATHE